MPRSLDETPLGKALASHEAPLVVVDERGRVVALNDAAERSLGMTEDAARGRPIETLTAPPSSGWSSRPPKAGASVPSPELALARDRELLEKVFDTLPTMVALIDPVGTVFKVNRAWEQTLGWTADDPNGRQLADILQLDPTDRRQMVALLERPDAAWHDVKVRTRTGRVIDVLWANVTLSDGMRVGIAQDVTERRRLEAQLLLADRMASLGTMAAGVAHEINNPLSYVLGNLSYVTETLHALSERASVTPDDLREFSDAIAEAISGAERMRDIVRDLKLFSRSNESSHDAVDLGSVIATSLRMLKNQIIHRAQLVTDIAPTPKVKGSASRLGQVFVNLIQNAVQALPERDQQQNEVRIAVRSRGATEVVTEVRDNGLGIPPDLLARVFDPFFTTKPVGVGTGLGLSVCHGIIATLGGRIEVESEPGQGACFRVVLPVAEADTRPKTGQRPAVTSSIARRLLLVDDDPGVGRIMQRLLGPSVQLHHLTNPHHAVERLRAGERYDAVILDLMMPEMSGMDLFEEVKRIAPELAPRCGFLTGGVFTAQARAFLDALPPGYLLEKPFDRAAVHQMFQRLVQAK